MSDLLERDVTAGPYAYAEPTWQDELAASGDDPVFDQMNLREHETGIEGDVFLSTEVARHGPRVKYYLRAAKNAPSFSVSIGSEPRVVATSLDARTTNQRGREVAAWVALNREALLAFWNEGAFWSTSEVKSFHDSLVKLPK